ncbi:PorV/PorQ family protein [candidate division WOR-3 bacterium]|nr:PorV/PorQ family protein [candidate division WOR-3 bacterium]
MRKVYILLLALFVITPFSIYSYDLLNLPISAAQGAIGGEGGAYFGPSNTIAANPAALAYFNGRRAELSFVKYPQSVNIGGMAYYQGFDKIGVLSAALNYCNYGRIEGTDEYGNVTHYFTPQAFLLNMAFSREIVKSLAAAVIFKYGYSSIDTMANMFMVGGFDVNYKFNDLRLGLLIDDIGGELMKGYGSVPIDIKYRFSSSYALAENSYILLVDIFYDKTNGFDMSAGFEWNINGALLFRMGYIYSDSRNLKYDSSGDILAGFNLGLGVRTKRFNLDYSYTPLVVLGDAHRITLGINF